MKFVGNRFNILQKITLKFAPYGGWIREFYVHGSTLRDIFEKRATVLRSVAIVVADQTEEEYHDKLLFDGGFDSLHLLNQLTNLELTNVCIRSSQLLTTLASTNKLISLKLCRMRLYPHHRRSWNFMVYRVPTWDQFSMLDLMKAIARIRRLRCLHLTSEIIEDDHVSALLPICSQLQQLDLIGNSYWKVSRLSNESILFIANHCRDLKVLNISGHLKVTSKGVNEVLEKCPKLESITLHSTCVILNELKKRRNGFPSLEIRKTKFEDGLTGRGNRC